MTVQRVKLADVVDVKGGKRLPAGAEFASEPTAHPYIRGQDIRDGRIRAGEQLYITEAVFEKLRRYTVRGGDVCITIVGNIGDVGVAPPELDGANLTENAVKLIPTTSMLDSRFLAYALLSPAAQQQMKLSAAGAAQPKLGIYKVNDIEIPFPAVDTQRRIASILSAYDDLIENNTRRIAILEEMARRIYEEWFVRFRFPGHEGVRMVESELGLVPASWPVVRLDDVLVLQRGFDLPKQDRTEGPFPIISATGTSGSHHDNKVKGPGVVTGRSGSLGTVMYVEGDFWPLNTTLWVKQFIVGSPLYAYYVLRSIDLVGFNSGAAVPTLNRNDIHGLPVLSPTSDVLARFDEVAGPMMKLKRQLELKNTNLRTTRDLLLPKLISGELDVSALPEPEARAA